MKHLVTLILTSVSFISFGQDHTAADTTKIICYVESMPVYPGGYSELNTFIRKNLKYPNKTTRGDVMVEFTVNEGGSLSNFRVVKGLDESADNRALDMIRKMPNWIPAKQDGKPIVSKMVIRIKFS